MRTITQKIYKFDELSDEAKERAREWYRQATAEGPYPWSDDCLASLQALATHFGGKLADYGVDFYGASYSNARFDMPDDLEPDDIEARLASLGEFDPVTLKGLGDCKLTGYCADESAIDGFRQAYAKGERDLETLMQAAFEEWLKDEQSEAQAMQEDDAIDDAIESNDYEFTENGERARV